MATVDEVMAWLTDFANDFNFLRPGIDQNLGRDMANVAVDQIQQRANTQHAGASGSWPANKSKYAEWKARVYGIGPDEPNYRTGQMLSRKSLYGRTRIGAALIELVYGADTPAASSASGQGFDAKRDGTVTDTEKAGYAHDVYGRPFYELDDEIANAVTEVAADNLENYIRTEGA